MHDTVRFHATAFNTSEPRDYFINDTCFGDDFGQWLKPRLTEVGYEVFGPEQEDWGWYLDCRLGDTKRTLNVGYIGEPDNVWQLIVQEPVTLVERLFGRMKSVSNQLQMDLHRISISHATRFAISNGCTWTAEARSQATRPLEQLGWLRIKFRQSFLLAK